MAEGGEISDDLSTDIKDWSTDQVRKWILRLNGVDEDVAETLRKEEVNGASLLLLDRTDLKDIGVSFGPAKLIIHARDELVEFREKQPGNACKPYPFGRNHDTYRYIENNILDTVESGASDFIEPCHEYKAFTQTTDETKMEKFIQEVIRFAAACMNSRTNGTIHFGIGDKQQGYSHGQILGVVVEDKEAYAMELKSAIDAHFEHKHKEAAQKCIKPPRFVGVLNRNMTSSDKCVIEVDIAPDSVICEDNVYHTYTQSLNSRKNKKKAKENPSSPEKLFYVRDGGSTRNLAKNTKEYEQFVENVMKLSELRKKAEENHLSDIKSSTQGSRLAQMITGGTLCLDKSRYEHYVVVTNKSHPRQLESLGFLVELNPTAVLDFDPESAKHGLLKYMDPLSTVSVHSPAEYKITEAVEDIAEKLKLTRSTSWIFCNGNGDHEQPCPFDKWLFSKGASVRDVISFLCRKDVLPNKRFLVIFLLLSAVSDRMDPLIETFRAFLQELGGMGQILCICDNEQGFTSWKNLIEAQCATDISDRCIYELSFAEVNGTILSLWSKNRISSRFLPCGGGSKVLLDKKVQRSLDTLEVLCVNECEGGNDDKITIEENFYRGGKVSWWNFYFSEQPGSTPFIKRDMFDFMKNTVIKELCSLKKACALLNLKHVTGCGGTTLAMHLLWDHRETFRCAVLRNNKADLTEVSQQVVKLLMYEDHEEKSPMVPVLLMIDDFDDEDKVSDLQQLIEAECVKKGIQSKSPQVLLLNCMRSQSSDPPETTTDTVFIGNHLSEKEQKLFEEKLTEIEKTHKNAETFYGFMIMKKNFKSEYIESVVHNTLKSFNINQSSSQLLAVLVLLNVYCKGSALSVSLCEEFLGLQSAYGTNKVEDGFGKFSNLIGRCSVESKVVFTGVKIIHSSIAKQCLHELPTAHGVKRADITDLLLNTDKLYESTQGRDKLLQDVRYILVKRQLAVIDESHFSPLIHDIARETPGLEELVLENAARRFKNDAVISQLLARYYYLKKRDFSSAKIWAKQARHLSKDSSYIADTSAQVIKHELKNAIEKNKEEPISPNTLKEYLKMAQEATEAFKETQRLAKKESIQRLSVKTDNNTQYVRVLGRSSGWSTHH
ncbi:LOW QUALITY PROTEIN: sterile alpha motif domain-containing protein 9-like [Salarias fasciatus]|uniref:LOW QUALITY PROTEIN: sterile alpha motif domain-containing protein 9-like n=1 Tax=Salarias fasciatus TaxID=181472 RepID=UPI001176E823|nr:LOW QUALITY PROTEIN: sterile alpha motif domain-containing protein 9-like [Salarias fasciatus]